MKRIRYHSDCDYFSGSENMLANFLNDERLSQDYDVSLSYRASREYEEGLGRRVRPGAKLLPLEVLDFHQVSGLANGWPAPLRFLYKTLTRLVLVKYWIGAWDTWVLYRSLKRDRVDLLQINNGGFPGAVSCLAAAVAGRLAGVGKVVHVVNNLPRPYTEPDRWIDRPLDALATECSTVFVTGSEFARKDLARALKLSNGRATSIANGIASRAITEGPQNVRQRLGISADRPLLAVVAILEPRKGHRVLLEALARLKAEGLNPFPFTALGGDGSLRAELESLTENLGLQNDVRFLGWVSNHFDLFNAADIVALPSIGFEDFPNVTIEAMGLGKAVVATDVGGVGEQIVDKESGLLVRPGSVEDLAQALRAACSDPASRERLGRAAQRRFQERFTEKASVDRYRELYRSLLTEAAS